MTEAAISALLAATSLAAAPRDQYPTDWERRILAQYADCVVKRKRRWATRFVVERSADEKIAEKVRISDCVPRGHGGIAIWMQRPLLHFALADALIRRDPSLQLGDPRAIPALDHGTVANEVRMVAGRWNKAQNAKQLASQQAVAAATIGLFRFGECVVRAAPSESTELVRSDVTTDAERAALRKLRPAFAACLEKDATVAFSPEAARGTVALNYVRLATAPRVASQTQEQAE